MDTPILTQPYVYLGCPTLGAIIVALTIQRWWKKGSGGGKKKGDGEGGGRSYLDLLPFVLSLCYGLIIVLACSGWSGLGILTRLGLWGGNGIGYAYLVWGIGGDSPEVTRANPVVLTDGGYCVLALWTALIIGNHVWGRRLPRIQNIAGTLAGIFLGMAAGIAGVMAVPLASGLNLAGSWWTGGIQ
ncbi:hypothetical protein [Streptomyces sp. BE230]|uniref:hypothetical protein n=1 Tax=Streptomyces sp. BE230 TaxID=3002526 RepID=UPI002ED257BA|nr:hypothetical protein [Streptomyces sp. BE230]